MTREEFDMLNDSTKKYFAKEGEELRPITELTKEDLAMYCREIKEILANIPTPDNWGFDESGHIQVIDALYGGKYE